METKKSSKGLIVLIVVLIIFLLGALAHIYYDKQYIDKNLNKEIVDLNKKYNKVINEIKQKDQAEIENNKTPKKDQITENKNYLETGPGQYHYYSISDLGIILAENGEMYYLSELSSSPLKLNIKEKDVLKATYTHIGGGTAEYIILKNGKVLFIDVASKKTQHVWKEYKVTDIDTVPYDPCKTCPPSAKIKLTLQDGTTKILEN